MGGELSAVPVAPRSRGPRGGPALALLALLLVALAAGCASAPPAGRAEDVPREVRALWVAAVDGIDWPSRRGLPADARRAEMDAVLDRATALHLNAVFLQVRPAGDALYASALEPWSEWLSGEQGRPPDGCDDGRGDPLAEWIDAAHARGLELHAWFNPFRARQPSEKSPAAPTHVSATHPEWVRRFDTYLWLDPGEPAAREHSLAVMLDVVARYDVDGVHLDDYFYPYPKKGVEFDDAATFAAYRASGGTLERADWRRSNVDAFVRDLHARVKAAKPWVRVSVSPFGIWRPGNPPGVAGFDAYEGLAADAPRWLREGWVDLLIPQIYWRIGAPAQPHAALAEWWAAGNPLGRTVAVGLIPSRVPKEAKAAHAAAPANAATTTDAKSWPAWEIINQIVRGRETRGVEGFALFSARPLVENRQGLADALAEGVLAGEALMPPMPWCARGPRPPAPRLAAIREGTSLHVRLDACPDASTFAHVVRARGPAGWTTRILPRGAGDLTIPAITPSGPVLEIAAAGVDRYARLGRWSHRRVED